MLESCQTLAPTAISIHSHLFGLRQLSLLIGGTELDEFLATPKLQIVYAGRVHLRSIYWLFLRNSLIALLPSDSVDPRGIDRNMRPNLFSQNEDIPVPFLDLMLTYHLNHRLLFHSLFLLSAHWVQASRQSGAIICGRMMGLFSFCKYPS